MAQDWQEIDATCRFCHWWQKRAPARLSAMTTFLLILFAAAMIALVGYLLAVTIRSDGYGSTRPPAGRPRDPFEPRLN
jgi:hypothetical protein